ncbi:hypothetical protein MMC07_004727 [Pseudocyphellaria aurata]|nr:hypothetical protein [Pseudocyphellaria aurata]
MSEDKGLLARIGQLAGHINLHKNHTPLHGRREVEYTNPPQSTISHRVAIASKSTSWKSSRSAPYPRLHATGAKSAVNPHRNRTLVLNKSKNHSQACVDPGEESASIARISEPEDHHYKWVSKNDRHRQLIASSVFDKETQIRKQAMDETRRRKILQRDQWEKLKLEKHLRALDSTAAESSAAPLTVVTSTVHRININGLVFEVVNGGSKLSRIRNASSSAHSTPKKASIGGVTFFRSRNGNLYRSGIVKADREKGKIRKILEPCKRFSTTGKCSKGPRCLYLHNPATVAICKGFLQKETCLAGDFCDLSHDASPERVPACLHFLRGNCSNPSCRYAHVRVNPSASICRNFAILGYCGKGAVCAERHVQECPDYANNGACGNKNCHLPHVDRAGQIRNHAAKSTDISQNSVPQSGDASDTDILSDEEEFDEIDSDDVDSDGLDNDFIQLSHDNASQTLSQQQDFVHF